MQTAAHTGGMSGPHPCPGGPGPCGATPSTVRRASRAPASRP